MNTGNNFLSCLGVKVSQLKVICGVSLDSTAREERAVSAVVSDPIPSAKFLSVFKQRNQRKQLDIEFKALARNQENHSTNAALRNVLLNSKQEVVPYDHSRVIVWDSAESRRSDYFNASYIDGYNGPKEYIASQGPTIKCMASFWHMVWQEGVTCIVMATGLFENAVQQCDKYWADSQRRNVHFGQIHIWHEKNISLAQLTIRTLRIQKEGCAESRLLIQYEMTGFHDENPDPALLLDVRRRVSSLSATHPGPVLVHCRCGGGRTAVYIAVDFCLQQLQSEDRVDVYSSVLHLRRFRKNMVRSLSQYKQIYAAVAMFIQCGLTVYPADTLPAIFQVNYAGGIDSKCMKLEKEFQTLQSIVPKLSIGDCASGHRVENRSKSRDIMMLPPERARPYLPTTDCGENGTDFINAVYVDGYQSENSYLVTQWPMKKTTGDFWRLMYDFKIKSVVFLNELRKFSHRYPRFWPKELDQTACYGPISVKYVSCVRNTSIVIRTFSITKIMNNLVGSDEVTVKIFQVLHAGQHTSDSWQSKISSGSIHRSSIDSKDREKGAGQHSSVRMQPKSVLSLIELVSQWQKLSMNRQPVCIISKDGCSRAGLYCAVAICCDQVELEKEVDVFSAVRRVRKNRPQLVPNIEEYRYIYYFMTEFIAHSESKPDIIISEPSNCVLPSYNYHHSSKIPTGLPHSTHGRVYVTAQGKGSDSCSHPTKKVKANRDTITFTEDQFPCPCHNRHFQLNTSKLSLTNVPCRLGYLDESNVNLMEHNKLNASECDKDRLQRRKVKAPDINNVIEDNINSSRNAFLTSNILTGGHITTLQPLSDIHHISADSSIMNTLSQQHSPSLSLNLHSSSSLQILSRSPEKNSGALSQAQFLTPQKYQNGRVSNGTSPHLSPGSLCKSSSFFSCNSTFSINSNNQGSCLFSTPAEKSSIYSPDVISEIILHPMGLNSFQVKTATKMGNDDSGCADLSSPVSSLFQADSEHIKTSSSLNDSSNITMIHASYASLCDSVPGSANDDDLSRVTRKTEVAKEDFCLMETDIPQKLSVKLNSVPQPYQEKSGKFKNQENASFVKKIPTCTVSMRRKIKLYRNKKITKRITTSSD